VKKILCIQPFDKAVVATVTVPGDKSITHRAFLMGAMACGGSGVTRVHTPLLSGDTMSTIVALQQLGVQIKEQSGVWEVWGHLGLIGKSGLHPKEMTLNANNSGTTTRLLLGVLAGAGMKGRVTILGDASLCKRPMARIVEPLKIMGAEIVYCKQEGVLPLCIRGATLQGIRYQLPQASAQVKSGLLLAGLNAMGSTVLGGEITSRNHTEILMRQMGADIAVSEEQIVLRPSVLCGTSVQVVGDVSSAAFWMVLAALCPHSKIKLPGICCNPTRTGILSIFDRCGVQYGVKNLCTDAETVGDIEVEYVQDLKPFCISEQDVPSLIDELPILCVLACFCKDTSCIGGIKELLYKESNRITNIVNNLKQMGANIVAQEEQIVVVGDGVLQGGASLDCLGDHRIVMALAIAALASKQGAVFEKEHDIQSVAISYPNFFAEIENLRKTK